MGGVAARFDLVRMSLEGPRRSIVHAIGVLYSVRNVKYSSNIEKAADVAFKQIFDSVDDRGANSEGNTVVVQFVYPS